MSRRIFLPLTVVLILIAILAGAAPTAARTGKIALGISQYAGNGSVQSVLDFAQKVGGQKPASWTLWSTWGDPYTKAFPSDKARALLAAGVTPMIWWEPMKDRTVCSFAKHRLIASGKHDRYITRWARAAKAAGGTILLRYAQEINGAYFPWSVRRCGNTADAFKRGWRRIHGIFKKVGATNVKFLWSVSKQACRPRPCNPYAKLYPGDPYVHYAGFSSFNWGTTFNKGWKSMEAGVSVVMTHIRKVTRKPVIVVELASNSEGGNKPQWIRQGYPAVYEKFPQIKGIVYLNVDLRVVNHPDWSLNTPFPEALEAYADVVSQPRFQGRFAN